MVSGLIIRFRFFYDSWRSIFCRQARVHFHSSELEQFTRSEIVSSCYTGTYNSKKIYRVHAFGFRWSKRFINLLLYFKTWLSIFNRCILTVHNLKIKFWVFPDILKVLFKYFLQVLEYWRFGTLTDTSNTSLK